MICVVACYHLSSQYKLVLLRAYYHFHTVWYHRPNPILIFSLKNKLMSENQWLDICIIECIKWWIFYFFSELILSSIDIDATGDWECLVKNSYGNSTKQVEIVVLETAAPYCPAERIINNKGDFRYDFLGWSVFHVLMEVQTLFMLTWHFSLSHKSLTLVVIFI